MSPVLLQGRLFLFIYILCLHFGTSYCRAIIPRITVTWQGPDWHNWTLPTTGKPAVLSDRGDDLFIYCEAPFPIRWNISGRIGVAEIVKIQPVKVDLSQTPPLFRIASNFFFREAHNFSDLAAASATIYCQDLTNYKNHDELSVFVKAGHSFIVPTKPVVVTDSLLIPCPTTDPRTRTTLHLGNEAQALQDVTYIPTKGFHSNSNTPFNGDFTCRNGRVRSEPIRAEVTHSIPNLHFSPKSQKIRAFSDEVIKLECSSNIDHVDIQFSDKTDLNISFSVNTPERKIVLIEMTDKTAKSRERNAYCGPKSGSGQRKHWSFEFIEAPILYLDNFEGEVDCLSSLSPKSVQTVRCINSIHCDHMTHCFQNTSMCNFKKQKQFFASKDTTCWVEKLQTGINCSSVPYSHLNGIAQCTVLGLTRKWEYFVSLEFLRYSDWRDAPPQELLRMDEVGEVLYTNHSNQFFCMGTAFLLADSLSFELQFKNGTRKLLQDDGITLNISNPYSENPRKIDEFNVIGVLDIMLPIEAVAVRCLAPMWNSSDPMITSRHFETKHLLLPEITGEGRIGTENFIIGHKNQRLTCHAKGDPPPQYIWRFRKDKNMRFMNVSQVFSELKTSIGSNGEGYLEFPNPDKKYSGAFECIANNSVGEAKRVFDLDVSDEPISNRTVVYIVTVILILFILAIVIAALVIFKRRYDEAKELVRSLTDSEIDEFFEGRPELLKNTRPTSVETVEFLPYNKDYEIQSHDLEFDQSEQNLLGSGEFAYVVKGKIVSKARPVAIKISKGSADVSLFKSLLSEVKIMIYIGEHENVVRLLGVNTDGIRNRCIYIATEICTLGSLDQFLRKARPNFVNLMDANQEIDMKLMPQEPVHVSTLDLINFATQIARGMEYLAFKCVIHADLAGRNVLLTSDRVAKISDFGLSKKLYECNNYVKKSKTPLPWRWMATEALTTLTFSTKTDVWSYGVTLYEVFTLGDIPFPNEQWDKEFLNRLASGMRMGRPKYSTQEIYSKIVACWENDPEIRPAFSTLRASFEQLLEKYQPQTTKSKGEKETEVSDEMPPVTEPLYANSDSFDADPGYSRFEQRQYVNTDGTPEENTKPSYANLE